VKNNGVQLLIHLQGSVIEGNTFTIENQTPYRIAIILELINSKHSDLIFHESMNPMKYWNKKSGPYFFQVENNLVLINRLVQGFERLQTLDDDDEETETDDDIYYEKKFANRSMVSPRTYDYTAFRDLTHTDLKWITRFQKRNPARYAALTNPEPIEHPSEPMKQSAIRRNDDKSGFVAAWANGFFHGSYGNPNKSRVSLTVPLSPHAPTDFRFINRITNIYDLIHGTQVQQNKANDWLIKDKKTYYDGFTHKNIAYELELVLGPFRNLVPNKNELEIFMNFVYNRDKEEEKKSQIFQSQKKKKLEKKE
jgi:hypothetical protein